MLQIKEALRLIQQCYDVIASQAAEDTVEAVDVITRYKDWQEDPLDFDAMERLMAAFEKWFGVPGSQPAHIENATPGPWQLGEPETNQGLAYTLVPIWGGCLDDPDGRHFVVGYVILHDAGAHSTLSRWSETNAAVLASSLDLYAAARALLKAEVGNETDLRNAVRLAAAAMAKIERMPVPQTALVA
jgi:hypothetical protein